jgi:hypothetical protein
MGLAFPGDRGVGGELGAWAGEGKDGLLRFLALADVVLVDLLVLSFLLSLGCMTQVFWKKG